MRNEFDGLAASFGIFKVVVVILPASNSYVGNMDGHRSLGAHRMSRPVHVRLRWLQSNLVTTVISRSATERSKGENPMLETSAVRLIAALVCALFVAVAPAQASWDEN